MSAFETKRDKVLELNLPSTSLNYEGMFGNQRGVIHLVDKTDYSFYIYHISEHKKVVTELYYNLRNKEYWLKRNGRQVKFRDANVDHILPSHRVVRDKFFAIISTDDNKDMYEFLYRKLGSMANERVNKLSRFLIRLISEFSHYELLYKLGLREQIDHVVINPHATKPHEIMGISRTGFKVIQRLINLSSSRIITAHDMMMKKNDPDFDRELLNHIDHLEKLDNQYGLNKIDDFLMYESFAGVTSQTWINSVLEIVQFYNLNKSRAIEYAYYETHVSQGLDRVRSVIQYWKDYLRMCEDMRLTSFEKYPKSLIMAHDVVSMNYNLSVSDREKELFSEAYQENKHLECNVSNFSIIAPEDPSELVDEGNQLGHCVGSYVKNVANKNTYVLFMRKSSDLDKSYMTLEVRDSKVVQAKKRFNAYPNDEDIAVINNYAAKRDLEVVGY